MDIYCNRDFLTLIEHLSMLEKIFAVARIENPVHRRAYTLFRLAEPTHSFFQK